MKNSSTNSSPLQKIQYQYEHSKHYLKKNAQTILTDLGLETSNIHSLKDMTTQLKNFSQKNPSPHLFMNNLDYAFYEIRQEFKWKSSMLKALCKQKIQTSEEEILETLQTRQQKYKDLVVKKLKHWRA